MDMLDSLAVSILKKEHPDVAEFIRLEAERQDKNVELIASENFPSEAVKLACATGFMAKYSEGYPSCVRTGSCGRYYGGCTYVDLLEQECCDAWRRVFSTDYHVNVQPHSGSHANMAAYMSVLDLGDTILAMDMSAGSHLTHSSPASFVTKLYNVCTYGLDENGLIDYEGARKVALEKKPKLIVVGASAYSRFINFKKFREIADEVGALMMVDMAHIAGLIATGYHWSPFGIADIITSTTQKTLRGPRGGLIFCKPELAKKVDSAVFPRTSGGPAQNIICAKLVAAQEASTDEFKKYIGQVVKNTAEMAYTLQEYGYEIVTGGTDNHLFLVDFSRTNPNITGRMVQNCLDSHYITVNKNMVPGDKRTPQETSGIRIGLAAMTTKGWDEDDCANCAKFIDKYIRELSR